MSKKAIITEEDELIEAMRKWAIKEIVKDHIIDEIKKDQEDLIIRGSL
jgi:hypothetical protein